MRQKIVDEVFSIILDAFQRRINGDSKNILYQIHSLDKIDEIGIDEKTLDQAVLLSEVISVFWEYGLYGCKAIVLCRTDGYPPLHMVLCISDKKVFIDTVYVVDNRFKADFKTRNKVNRVRKR